MKGPFVPLSVSYRENDRMLGVEPLAELLFVRGLAFAKEKFSDGFIGERQLRLLAHDLLMTYSVDMDSLVKQLVDVGLWEPVPGGWVVEGWADWNTIDASRAGLLGNHERWHVRRGLIDEACDWCLADRPDSPPIAPDVAPESGQPSGLSQDRDRAHQKKARAAEFAAWWVDYPRKTAKKEAERAYLKARQSASAEQLASGLERSVNQWRRENRPHDKIPYPATWLNKGQWEDDYSQPQREEAEWLS